MSQTTPNGSQPAQAPTDPAQSQDANALQKHQDQAKDQSKTNSSGAQVQRFLHGLRAVFRFKAP